MSTFVNAAAGAVCRAAIGVGCTVCSALGSVLCGRLRFPLRKTRSEGEFVRFVFGKPIRSTVFGGFGLLFLA